MASAVVSRHWRPAAKATFNPGRGDRNGRLQVNEVGVSGEAGLREVVAVWEQRVARAEHSVARMPVPGCQVGLKTEAGRPEYAGDRVAAQCAHGMRNTRIPVGARLRL
jgi:hypothetical protein